MKSATHIACLVMLSATALGMASPGPAAVRAGSVIDRFNAIIEPPR